MHPLPWRFDFIIHGQKGRQHNRKIAKGCAMDDRHGTRCPCCHEDRSSVDRRAVVAGLVALPAMGANLASAQDLLDPTRLRSSRVGTEALATRSNRPPDWKGPEYARDMANSVTSAILSLVRA